MILEGKGLNQNEILGPLNFVKYKPSKRIEKSVIYARCGDWCWAETLSCRSGNWKKRGKINAKFLSDRLAGDNETLRAGNR